MKTAASIQALKMRGNLALCLLTLTLFLWGCASEPAPQQKVALDPTSEPWYGQTVNELAGINREARESFEQHHSDEAAALILKGEALSTKLISASRPTLGATEAASDLDHLYGQMLLSNRNYGWARLFFQKNLVRWKYWKPQTPDTERRFKEAQNAIADCDRHIVQ